MKPQTLPLKLADLHKCAVLCVCVSPRSLLNVLLSAFLFPLFFFHSNESNVVSHMCCTVGQAQTFLFTEPLHVIDHHSTCAWHLTLSFCPFFFEP